MPVSTSLPPAVQLRGSGNLIALVQRAAERYMREHAGARIVVSGGGTQRGYKALLDGTADIAMASSAPADEIAKLRFESATRFVVTTVGFVAMVPIVHRDNVVDDVTMEQLRDIFTGHVSSFGQVGGQDGEIKVLVGSPRDGLTESWRAALIDADDHHTPRIVVLNAKERLERVAVDPAAISFVSAADVDGRVKAVSVEGQDANEQTVREGQYRLVAPLTLVTTKNVPSTAKEFVAYVVKSATETQSRGFIAAGVGDRPQAASP